MVKRMEERKLRGGYYTPHEITKFISEWAITSTKESILEPSCGDGNFIEASIQRLKKIGLDTKKIKNNILGIELMKEEADKTKKRVEALDVNSNCIINSDFFSYILKNKSKKFDVIIGNPPFIRYQNFPEVHRDLAIKMMRELGFKPNKLTNIWLPFLVISSSLLSKNGKLGMVIPAELFSVKYASETRVYLSKFFERITLVTFNKLVFDGIQQEVVLLLCEKKVKEEKGIRIVEFHNLDDMLNFDFNTINSIKVKTIDHSSEKWTKYFLEEEEINLLRRIKQEGHVPICDEIMDVDVGIVTGKNDFFMLNKSDVEKWNLQDYTQKVVGRSNQLKGIIFNNTDFEINSSDNLNTYLFIPPNVDFKELPKVCKKYILYGEEHNHHIGYKCRIRKRWYITPSLWNAEAYALRQIHHYPKLVLNKVESSSTDTIHRIRFLFQHEPKYIMLSFLNSLTFAFSEITGRSYGGGVMTFEPTEIEKLPIPIVDKIDIDFNKIDELMREKKISEILDIVDKAILIEQYGFTQSEVSLLRNIWKKLSNRRINRKRK
jgi:adenine-specific DNA-methyltransferase